MPLRSGARRICLLILLCIGGSFIPAASPAQELAEAGPKLSLSAALAFGFDLYETSEFNTTLSRLNYPQIPEFSPEPWLGAGMTLYNFDNGVIASSQVRFRLFDFDSGEWRNRLLSTLWLLDGGYMFVRNRDLAVHASAGMLLGNTSITMSHEGNRYHDITGVLAGEPSAGSSVSFNTLHYALQGSIGAEFMFLHDDRQQRCYVAGVRLGGVVNPPFWTANGIRTGEISMNIPQVYLALSFGWKFL